VVPIFAWPSMACTERMSAPFESKSVANTWRMTCGVTFFDIPAIVAYLFTISRSSVWSGHRCFEFRALILTKRASDISFSQSQVFFYRLFLLHRIEKLPALSTFAADGKFVQTRVEVICKGTELGDAEPGGKKAFPLWLYPVPFFPDFLLYSGRPRGVSVLREK